MAKSPEIGRAAPEFSLPAHDGSTVTLDQFAGDLLVLYFYPRDDTPGCTKEALEFSANLAELSALGAHVLGVSRDPPQKHAAFVRRHALGVRLASDESGEVCDRYAVWVEKSLYGRSFMSVERATFLIGPDRCIRAVWRKVKVPGHVEAVLGMVRSLHADG